MANKSLPIRRLPLSRTEKKFKKNKKSDRNVMNSSFLSLLVFEELLTYICQVCGYEKLFHLIDLVRGERAAHVLLEGLLGLLKVNRIATV